VVAECAKCAMYPDVECEEVSTQTDVIIQFYFIVCFNFVRIIFV